MLFSHRMSRDINTFGKKLNSQARTFAKKSGGMAKSIHGGLHEFNNFAKPALGFATMLNPELAPFTAVMGAGLTAAEAGAKYGARFADQPYTDKQYKPRLER